MANELPYCTGPQFVTLIDPDRVAQMLTIQGGAIVGPGDVSTNATILQYLALAAGDIDAACREGNRYAASELANLVLPDPATGLITNSGQRLIALNATIAYGKFCVEYKQMAWGDVKVEVPAYEGALDFLQQANLGFRIFDIPGVDQAGVMTNTLMGAVLDRNPVFSIKNQPCFWGLPPSGGAVGPGGNGFFG